MRNKIEQDRHKIIYVIFTGMAVLCGLIWSVTNLGHDGEYQIAMSYRLLQGDKMFLEMWEPHQTSAFLTAALMWVYDKLFHTTTGIVLYLQVCGMLIRGGIALLLYRMLVGSLERPLAYGISLLYFMISPKDYALPEFSNLQLWYSTLLFICLWAYLKKRKRYLLVLGAIFFCLEVFSYPSCVIVYAGIAGILALYSADKWKDILIFTGVCAGIGLISACCFLSVAGADELWQCIRGMLALEPTHTGSTALKWLDYGKDLLKIMLVLFLVGAGGFAGSFAVRKFLGGTGGAAGEKGQGKGVWFLCCGAILLTGFFCNILSLENRCAYTIIFLFMIGAGIWNRRLLEGDEKGLYVCGSVIGGLGFLATLILTDLPFSVSGAYGLLAIAFALLPIKRQAEKVNVRTRRGIYVIFWCFVTLLAFRCAYVRTPLTGRGQMCSSFSGLSMVRTGPALGLITDAEGVRIQNNSYPEWRELIREGDKVWIVGSVVDTLGYLYQDVEVAAPSTMSTPYYGSAVSDYWRLNPDKYPDVVVIEGYFGQVSFELQTNEWLMSWLEEEYQPEQVIEGKYWNYYFRKAR